MATMKRREEVRKIKVRKALLKKKVPMNKENPPGRFLGPQGKSPPRMIGKTIKKKVRRRKMLKGVTVKGADT